MKLQKLTETRLAKAEILERSSKILGEGVLSRIKYNICNLGEKNRNKRIYEKAVFEKVMGDPDIKEKLEHRSLYAHAEHPEGMQSSTEKIAGVVTDIQVDENNVYAIMEVLDTPYGRICDSLLKAGCGLGVSTRAEGELEEMVNEADGEKYFRVVPESYKFVTVDWTADPSTYGAFPESVERDITSIVQKGWKENKIDQQYATCLLEKFKCAEAVSLCESIKKVNEEVYKCSKCGKKSQPGEDVDQTWFWSGIENTLTCPECSDNDYKKALSYDDSKSKKESAVQQDKNENKPSFEYDSNESVNETILLDDNMMKFIQASAMSDPMYETFEKLGEKAPEGWEGTVKAMKGHKDISNPWALSWYMKNKGFKSHKTKTGKDKKESVSESTKTYCSHCKHEVSLMANDPVPEGGPYSKYICQECGNPVEYPKKEETKESLSQASTTTSASNSTTVTVTMNEAGPHSVDFNDILKEFEKIEILTGSKKITESKTAKEKVDSIYSLVKSLRENNCILQAEKEKLLDIAESDLTGLRVDYARDILDFNKKINILSEELKTTQESVVKQVNEAKSKFETEKNKLIEEVKNQYETKVSGIEKLALESTQKIYEQKFNEIKETFDKEVKESKDFYNKKLMKILVEMKVKEAGLESELSKGHLALLESLGSDKEVEAKLDEIRVQIKEGSFHSNGFKGSEPVVVSINESITEEESEFKASTDLMVHLAKSLK